MTCCDLHGRNCEPPGELCCADCTEAAHMMGDAARGFHADGSKCSNPDLSGLVVHLKRAPYDVRIDRTTKWGNPFVIGRDGTRADVIAKYEQWLPARPDLMASLRELRGKKLGCWCAPQPCHGDVLVRLANA